MATAAAQAPTATVSMAATGKSQKVRYGERLNISGRVSQAGARRVTLEHAVRGARFRRVATVQSTANGSYRFAVRARKSGSYRAVIDGAVTSASRQVTVIGAVAGRARRHVLGTRRVTVKGRLRPALRGRKVLLQQATGHGWRTIDRARTGRGGRFRAAFAPRRAGTYRLRVRFPGDRFAAGASDRLPRVRVYRPGQASWYGPGFYGGRTACGGTLSAGTLGVAHKYLPCGTKVTFRYRGRSVTARVIDRGPYVAGRDWDLTGALKSKLGFGSTGTVWSTK